MVILKEVKVLCFHTLLQVRILKDLAETYGYFGVGVARGLWNPFTRRWLIAERLDLAQV